MFYTCTEWITFTRLNILGQVGYSCSRLSAVVESFGFPHLQSGGEQVEGEREGELKGEYEFGNYHTGSSKVL